MRRDSSPEAAAADSSLPPRFLFAERFSLWALGGMLSLPFLVPLHTLPIPSFHAQWLAAMLGLGSLAVLFGRSGKAAVPSIALVPGVLIGVLLLQAASGTLPYREPLWMAALYFLWISLLLIAVATLKERMGLAALADVLAACLLAGALANAVLALAGFIGAESPWIAQPKEAPLWGNLTQKNNFAHHIWLGVASALYLAARGRLNNAAFVAAILILIPLGAMSGSRATLVYAAWIVAAGFWWNVPGAARRGVAVLAIFCLALLALEAYPQFSPLHRAWTDYGETQAHGGYGSSEGIRVALLRASWQGFVSAPWLGTGFGSFPWQAFGVDRTRTSWEGIAEHPHNLFAQLLSEMGLLAALCVAAALALWWWRVARRRAEPAWQWLGSVAGIGLLHSMIEYPLWYAYFLGVLTVVLALGDDRTIAFRVRPLSLMAVLPAGLFVLAMLWADYRRLEVLTSTSQFAMEASAHQARNAAIVDLRRGSLFKPFADALLLAPVLPTRDRLEEKRTLCRLSLAFQPRHPAVFTCALLHELAGEHEQAQRLWRLASQAYPREVGPYRENVAGLLDEKQRAELDRLLARGQ